MADGLAKAKMSSQQRRQFFYKLSSFLPQEFRENFYEHLNVLNENSTLEEEHSFETHFRYALNETIRLGLLKRRDFFKLSAILSSAGLLQWLLPSQADASGIIPFAFMKRATASTSYVDDVFSTYMYTSNGATQTITNNIDLAGKGGLVWIKCRDTVYDNVLFDSSRGALNVLSTNTTNAASSSAYGTGTLTALNSNGFALGVDVSNTVNRSNATSSYVSWSFRKAAKFFDVVTYTGNGSAGRKISHNLGVAPGMIIVKATSAAGNWLVYHNSITPGSSEFRGLLFNSNASYVSGWWYNSAPTSTDFTVTSSTSNDVGVNYIAYLFAHDTSTNGIIQCGTYSGNGSTTGPTVNLGWEPQYVMIKRTDSTGDWIIMDNMRGMPISGVNNDTKFLIANTTAVESTWMSYTASDITAISPTTSGFAIASNTAAINASGGTYIYLAIRRPNKPPTSGTQVFNAILRTGDGNSDVQYTGLGFAPDLIWAKDRDTSSRRPMFFDRLRGVRAGLYTDLTNIESDTNSYTYFGNDGFSVAAGSTHNSVGVHYIHQCFRRAPGVLDIVAYTGTGSNATINHSLGVTPELMIVKGRITSTATLYWVTYVSSVGSNQWMDLSNTATTTPTANAAVWNNTSPTASVFSIGTHGSVNTAGTTYIAYLFATKSGISKVGSYTGDGTSNGSKIINCGFTTGARFILIKRTDSTGDWFVWDIVRGITASANDPHLSLNTISAEVTTDDSIDPDNSGFKVKQNTATNINVTSATYIFLAIA